MLRHIIIMWQQLLQRWEHSRWKHRGTNCHWKYQKGLLKINGLEAIPEGWVGCSGSKCKGIVLSNDRSRGRRQESSQCAWEVASGPMCLEHWVCRGNAWEQMRLKGIVGPDCEAPASLCHRGWSLSSWQSLQRSFNWENYTVRPVWQQ